MIYIFVPINNDGSRNCDYCCAVCLWSKPSLVISLLHQGAAAFFCSLWISAWSFVGVLVSGWPRGPVQKPVGPRMELTVQGQPYCSSSVIFSAGPGLWWWLCVHAQHGCVMNTSDSLRPRTWSVLYWTQGLSVLASWGVLGCGCYSTTML